MTSTAIHWILMWLIDIIDHHWWPCNLRWGGASFWLFHTTRIFCSDETTDNFRMSLNRLSTRSYVRITAVNPWNFCVVLDENNGLRVFRVIGTFQSKYDRARKVKMRSFSSANAVFTIFWLLAKYCSYSHFPCNCNSSILSKEIDLNFTSIICKSASRNNTTANDQSIIWKYLKIHQN